MAIARRIAIFQSQLSKPERRISTVRCYVAALGGELEIAAVVDGKRLRLSSGTQPGFAATRQQAHVICSLRCLVL